jgi:hypothetical protein
LEVGVHKVLGAAVLSLCAATAQADVTPNDRLPTHLLTCWGGVIADMGGGRLDIDFGSGTSVFYQNGGGQVSYDKIATIVNPTGGTTSSFALCCTQQLPGRDNRGKIYTTTNLRALDSWTLPDSQHSCRGA